MAIATSKRLNRTAKLWIGTANGTYTFSYAQRGDGVFFYRTNGESDWAVCADPQQMTDYVVGTTLITKGLRKIILPST